MLTIFVNIGWREGFPEMPSNQRYPLLQCARDKNKGIIDSWDVDVIDQPKLDKDEIIVINFGSDSFEGTDLGKFLRAKNIEHIYVNGQCTEHVAATTVKRAANMVYNAAIIKDAMPGFTDSNYETMLDILPLYAKVMTSEEFAQSN